jgi:hypothetical protein
MNSFSDYLENKVLQHVFTGVAYTQPSGRYLALFTSTPGENTPGTEVSGGAYVRQPVTFDVNTAFEIDPVGAPGVLVTAAINNAVVEFATATSGWGTVTHVGIFDASTSGNMLAFAALVNSRAITTGDIFRVPLNNLAISLD